MRKEITATDNRTPSPWELVKISTGWQVKHKYPAIEMTYQDGSKADPFTREKIIFEAGYSPEDSANAALISAAPEMLKALISAAKYIQYKENGGGLGESFIHPLSEIKAALTKATGG